MIKTTVTAPPVPNVASTRRVRGGEILHFKGRNWTDPMNFALVATIKGLVYLLDPVGYNWWTSESWQLGPMPTLDDLNTKWGGAYTLEFCPPGTTLTQVMD